jgi:hypothetical protein
MQRSSQFGLASIALAVLLAPPEAGAATVTVLLASKESYKVPAIVDEHDSLRIKDGERLVVYLPSGSIKRFLGEAGAGKIKVKSILGNESRIVLAYRRLTDFIMSGGVSTKDMAGSKGLRFDSVPINVSGTICLAPGTSPKLERNNVHVTSATVTQLSSGQSRNVVWKGNEIPTDWPAEFLPIRTGGKYTITHEFLNKRTASVEFTIIKGKLDEQTSGAFDEDTLNTLAENACLYQLKVWLGDQAGAERQRR